MGTQERQLSKTTKSICQWSKVSKARRIHWDYIMLSDNFVRDMVKTGRLKTVVDTPSKVVTFSGGYHLGPCENCILAVNCSEMCEQKELSIILDLDTRVEMI